MDFVYRTDYDYRYQLNSDGTKLVPKPGRPIRRFGGVEYLADHDFIFGSDEQGLAEVGVCVKRYMEDYFRNYKNKLEDFTLQHLNHLKKKGSKHINDAIDEIIEFIELSNYYHGKSMIRRKKETKCRLEERLEARDLERAAQDQKPL